MFTLPRTLGLAVRRFFDAKIDAELPYPLNHREVLDRHLVAGITTVWNLPYAHKRGMAAELNRSMLGISAALSDHEVEFVPDTGRARHWTVRFSHMTESSTMSALMDAAEVAFTERGVGQASLRAIMRAAGTDPAAVHYHFGSRDGLVEAVLDRVLAPLNERRLELLGALEDRGRPLNASVEELLDALLRPDLEAAAAIGSRNPGAVRLIGTIYAQPSRFVKTLVERHFGPVARRFMPPLVAALPHLSPGELSWRVRWHVFGVLGALLCDDEFAVDTHSLEATLRPMITAAAGALTAPQPPGRSQ